MRISLALLMVIALNAHAGQGASAPSEAAASEPKTLKERLGDKASDDQRVNNCHVPVGQRGPKPRPDTCTP